MDKNKTYYGFSYDKTTQVMLNHIPAMLREIEAMTDSLMNEHDETFISDDISDTGQGYYADDKRHYEAHLEVTRLLISWLFNCLPPVLDEAKGELFILPDELTIDHATSHFKEIAESGYDAKERAWNDLWDKYEGLPWDNAMERVHADIKALSEGNTTDEQ